MIVKSKLRFEREDAILEIRTDRQGRLEMQKLALELEKLASKDCTIKAEKKKKKRSKDANAYMWVLNDKLAATINIPKDEMHRMLMSQYGTAKTYIDEDGNEQPYTITVNQDIPQEALYEVYGYLSEPIGTVMVDGKTMKSYRVMKSSKEMTSQEMYELLEGIINECQILEIPTETPNEIAKWLSLGLEI